MIQLVRIDGRLIHGMVAVTWCGSYNPQVLVVANTQAANDEFHKMTLKLAKPGGVESVYVWDLDKAVERLNGSKYANKKIFVSVATVEDAYYLAKRCPGIKHVNVGPEVDGEDGRATEGKVKVSDNVYLSEAKYLLLKELNDDGIEVFAQVTPAMPKVDFSGIAKAFNK